MITTGLDLIEAVVGRRKQRPLTIVARIYPCQLIVPRLQGCLYETVEKIVQYREQTVFVSSRVIEAFELRITRHRVESQHRLENFRQPRRRWCNTLFLVGQNRKQLNHAWSICKSKSTGSLYPIFFQRSIKRWSCRFVYNIDFLIEVGRKSRMSPNFCPALFPGLFRKPIHQDIVLSQKFGTYLHCF